MSPGLKFLAGGVFVALAIGYLAMQGAVESWQYYLSVDEAGADAASLEGHRLRISGRVVQGSLTIGTDRRQASFDLSGESHSLHVTCNCVLPDNLAEEIEVVVEGTLTEGVLSGNKVITRCASKYEATDADGAGREPAAELTN